MLLMANRHDELVISQIVDTAELVNIECGFTIMSTDDDGLMIIVRDDSDVEINIDDSGRTRIKVIKKPKTGQ